jgi:hypothetical protein
MISRLSARRGHDDPRHLADRSACTARGVSRLSSSPSNRAPIVRPSTATKAHRAERQAAPERAHRPFLGLARAVYQLVRADPDDLTVQLPLQPRSQGFAHPGWNQEVEVLAQRRLHDGGGDDMVRRLLQ